MHYKIELGAKDRTIPNVALALIKLPGQPRHQVAAD